MKKVILTLSVLVIIMQAYAQINLKAIIRDERSGTTNRFITLQDNEQVSFDAASAKPVPGMQSLSHR